MSKHTPGPWSAQQRQDQGVYDIFALNKPSPFATAQASSSIEAEANASLIAAAPELLAFADRVADVLEYYNENRGLTRDSALCELFELARAAIAKATGA